MNVPTKETFPSLPVHEQIAQLARVDAKTRQELIVSSRNSLDLVRTLSSEMLFYTVKEIGLADAVGLVALASPEQMRDMMDLDCWRRDRLDDRRTLMWLMLLDETGSGKLAQWALRADVELLVLLVKRHLEIVRKADVEEDPNFNQSLYFTFDDQYLLRFVDEPEPILHLLLERLRVLDYRVYTYILENSLVELESGLEEDAFRWRNARLADRSYPDYEEARSLFQPLPPESLRLERFRRPATQRLRFTADEELIPSDHALMLLEVADSFFLRILAALPAEDLEVISHELAVLANQIVIAEGCDPGELSEVRRCVGLAHDSLSIGLAYFAEGDEAEATNSLRETMLRPFFQMGLSLTLRLQRQAKQLEADLRGSDFPQWETLLDSPFRETYVGVRRPLPLFFRGLETPGEILYRRFHALADVKRVEVILRQIPIWFAVLRRWQLFPESSTPEGATLAVLWNTAFAHWVLTRNVDARPLNRENLGALQKRLQERNFVAELTEFLALAATQAKLTKEEAEAIRALAAFAQEKLREVLAVDAATTDLKFIEGLLMVE